MEMGEPYVYQFCIEMAAECIVGIADCSYRRESHVTATRSEVQDGGQLWSDPVSYIFLVKIVRTGLSFSSVLLSIIAKRMQPWVSIYRVCSTV